MSLRSIVQGLSEAYFALREEKRGVENAMNAASSGTGASGKVILPENQTATVGDQKVVVVDDGASRRIFPLSK